MNRRFHQYALERVVHLLRDEIDLRALHEFPAACDNLDGKPHAYIGGPFRGNVDVGFEFRVFIDRRQ